MIEADDDEEGSLGAAHSRAEIEQAYIALSPAELARLSRWGNILSQDLPGMTSRDLLQEGICRMLEGRRAWKVGVGFRTALAFVMRSIATNRREGASVDPVDVSTLLAEDRDTEVGALTEEQETNPSPLASIIAAETLSHLYEVFNQDEEVQMLIYAWAQNLRGDAARDECGMSKLEHDAARNRLRRRIALMQKSDNDK